MRSHYCNDVNMCQMNNLFSSIKLCTSRSMKSPAEDKVAIITTHSRSVPSSHIKGLYSENDEQRRKSLSHLDMNPATTLMQSITEGQLPTASHQPVILYPLAASCPAMYSPSELLWEQPQVFIQIFCVPGMMLWEKRQKLPDAAVETQKIANQSLD